MAVNIHIERVEQLILTPDANGQLALGQLLDGIKQEQPSSPTSSDPLGNGIAQLHEATTEIGPVNDLSNEKQETIISSGDDIDPSLVTAIARRNFLYSLLGNANSARRLQGYQTNSYRRPSNLKKINHYQAAAYIRCQEALQSACGHCALSENCKLKGDLEAWFDVHPYATDRSGKRRPGTEKRKVKVEATECREDFSHALREDPMAHCDPTERQKLAA